ncbi:MAG: Serpin (serine protease inhibitor) [Firmicutes bacterium ADurb.Bin300]|nr:MAG: Serpin (serine protease inhibitor) [Firmicutes bacterium ADurb.Bin300]
MRKILLISAALMFLLSGCRGLVPKTDDLERTTQGLAQPLLNEPKPLLPDKFDHEDKAYVSAAEKSNEFGLAVSEKLLTDSENLLYSPYSAYLALSCISAGASYKAKEELTNVLVPEGMTDEEFHRANAVLLGLLMDDETKPLDIATLICTDDDIAPDEKFAQNALDNYRGETASVDFSAPGAKDAINSWAYKKTRGLIPNALSDDPGPASVLVLVNSLYFSGRWAWEFDPEKNESLTFKGAKEETGATFMVKTGKQRYFEDEQVQAVKMDFRGSSSMAVILPKEGISVHDVIKALSEGSLELSFNDHKGTLKLPRFNIDTSHELNEVLEELGLKVMFDSSVNSFGGIAREELPAPVFISRVFQKAAIEVDEKGTTAAAVTVIEAPAAEPPPEEEPPPFEMIVDRPFILLLMQRARASEVILFVGVVNNID